MTNAQKASKDFEYSGLQYYVLARSGVICGFPFVAGNLYHHAVEMLMKSKLVLRLGLAVLAKFPYSHNLPNLWKEFKSEAPGEDLSPLDATLQEVHLFEELRYPDKHLDKLTAITAYWKKGNNAIHPATVNHLQFFIDVESIDELFAAIFRVCGTSFCRLSPVIDVKAREILRDRNTMYASWFLPEEEIPF